MARFTGTSSTDVWLGTSGDDIVTNIGQGLDVITTGAGNDTVTVGPDGGDLLGILPDIVSMGAGTDDHLIIDYRGSTAPLGMSSPILDLGQGGLGASLSLAGLEQLTFSGVERFTVFGGSADDIIVTGAGNDMLDGGLGVDQMRGGLGDDVYYVNSGDDVVTELQNQGLDTVNSTVSYSIYGGYVETLKLLGANDIDARGNGSSNLITGNGGANRIDGGKGADTLVGLGGNDTYIVDSLGDRVVEAAGEGVDTVNSSVTFTLEGQHADDLILTGTAAIDGTGNSLDNHLTGNGAANDLIGGRGEDVIRGGRGADVLTGGVGDDVFVYRSAAESSTTAFDRITDLRDGDVIDLGAIDAKLDVDGNNVFRLVDTFTGRSGQMTIDYDASTGLTSILMDRNGDQIADMKIAINGDHHEFTDFIF